MKVVPAGWKRAAIGDVCRVTSGATPKTSIPEYWGGEIPWITPNDMSKDRSQVLLQGERSLTARGYASCSAQLFPPGSVIVSSRAPVGYVAIAGREMCTNQGCKTATPPPDLDSNYLYWFMINAKSDLEARASGTTFKEISSRRFAETLLWWPEIGEQRRIVAILEEHLSDLDAAVESATHAKERTDALLHSYLLGLVLGDAKGLLGDLGSRVLGGSSAPPIPLPDGWSWLKWSEVGKSQNGRAFSSSLYRSEGVRLLRPGNLGADGRLVWSPSSTKHLPLELAEDYAAFLLEPGDLVMNLTAQSLKDDFLGRVCLVAGSDRALLNQRIARLKAVRISAPYALMVFRSKLFRRYVESLNTGSLIQHMYTKQVNEFWLPTPPSRDHERRLVVAWESFAETVQRLGGAASTAEVRARSLRRAVLAAAISGRLTGSGSDSEVIAELAEEESA